MTYLQHTTISYLSVKQSKLSPRVAVDDLMALLHEAKGRGQQCISHPQQRGCDSFDCFTERYEIVVLLPNSELTKGKNKRDADARTEDHDGWALSTSNNFAVCGQKHKVWVLVFLVRISGML